jgi:ATP-binding cassette subfamily A (ABC1) protein 3
LLTFIGCIVGSLDILEKNETIPFLMNQITNDSQIIYYSSITRNSTKNIINEIFSKYSSEDISKVKFEYIDFEKDNYVTTDGIRFMKEIYNIKHVKNKIKNNYVGYLFTKMNTILDRYEFTYFPDTISRQSTAIYANYLLKNLVRYASKNDKLEIEVINEPLPYTKEEKNDKQDRNNIIILFFISLAFSLIPANFITLIIKERENNSKHLQIISGISLFSYWFNNYIFELLKYYVIGGICIFLIFYYDYYKRYLAILYLLYGPAMVSFTYLFSFIFKSEDKGQTSILLINLLFGTLGGSAIIIMRLNDELVEKARVMAYIFRIIPSFCFCYGYNV